jgi:hypothetical protein
MWSRRLLLVVTMLLTAATSLGQSPASGPAAKNSSSVLTNMLLTTLPWLLMFVFVWGSLYLFYRNNQRTIGQHRERAERHWDHLEQKYDRIIALLEELTATRRRNE